MKKWRIRATYSFIPRGIDAENLVIEAETKEKAIKKAKDYMEKKWSKLHGVAAVWVCYEI
jgi:hypothetical protein